MQINSRTDVVFYQSNVEEKNKNMYLKKFVGNSSFREFYCNGWWGGGQTVNPTVVRELFTTQNSALIIKIIIFYSIN
jgi:hypothetical protein